MRAKREYKKSEASRQQVLDAAVKQLAKRGYARTSVSEIARAARMSKGVVHYHFASKDDLLVQVLQRCCARISERVRSSWQAPGTPVEKMRATLREMWNVRTDGSPEVRVVTDLMAQAVHEPALRKPLAIAFHALRDELTREFTATLAAIGLEARVHSAALPRLVTATLDGLAMHHLFDPPTPEEEEEMFRALEGMALVLFSVTPT